MSLTAGNFSIEIVDDHALTYTINGVTATSAGLYVTPMLNNVTGDSLCIFKATVLSEDPVPHSEPVQEVHCYLT